MPPEELEKTEIPRMAPDAVVEVRSPEDLQRDIDEKVRVYLAAGTTVIFLVDPIKKIVVVRDREQARTVTTGGLLAHAALPGFSMPASALFTLAKPRA
jgi:Uma2 family endonuclease